MDLVIRKFVTDPDTIRDPKTRNEYGNVGSITGIIVNTLVCIGELIVGFLTGSIAMVSDGIHNVADAGGSVISLLSFHLAAKKPDKEHPYGHGRMEYLFSIGFSVLLFVVAIQLLLASIDRIRDPEVVHMTSAAIVVMLVIMGMKLWLYRALNKIGKRIDSPILIANSLEYLSDVMATAGITIGLVVAMIFDVAIDGYLGVFVALMIGRAGFHVLRDSTNRLLGNEPDPKRVKEIDDFVSSYDGVMGTHDLIVHDYGPGHEFASIHVEVDARKDAMDSHNMIDRIERDAMNKLKLQLTIHMDPLLQDERTKAMRERVEKMVQSYNPAYSIHDVRVGFNGIKMVVSFDCVIPYSEKRKRSEIKESLAGIIHALYPNCDAHINVEHAFAPQAE